MLTNDSSRALPAPLVVIPVLVLAVLGGFVVHASPAFAAVSVSRSEIADGRLRIEGRAAANRNITVDGVNMTTSDSSGTFRVSHSPYTAPVDCTVEVNDGSATPATVRLTGCTVTTTSPPAPMPTTVSPEVASLGPAYVGAEFASTATRNLVNLGPDTTGPVSWEILTGALPDGLVIRIPEPAGRPPLVEPTYMYVEGIPTRVQTSTFTLRGTDANGLTATRTYTIEVNPARPLAIAPQPWPPLRVGELGNLWMDGSGGVQPYQWAVSGGQLPPGMSLVDDTPGDALIRIGGTPSASGTYTWTMRLTDAQSSLVDRTFSVTVGAEAGVSGLTLDPASVTGGSSATGTVTLSSPAPAAGASISLTSSHPAVASMQSNVFVLAAASTATFTVSTTAVTSPTTVTLSATYGGSTRSTTLTVEPAAGPGPISVTEVTLTPSTVTGGSSTSGSVRLSATAPTGGVVVTLSSTSSAAVTPAEVSIAAGATTATFPITTTSVLTSTTATISASHGNSTVSAVLTLSPATGPPATLSAPSLLSPANDSRWAPGVSRVFDWADVAGASTYTIQVSNTTGFTTVEVTRSGAASQLSLSFATEGTRYWRVRAHDGAGNPGPWSATRFFRIKT